MLGRPWWEKNSPREFSPSFGRSVPRAPITGK
jgi:hypothetical protein